MGRGGERKGRGRGRGRGQHAWMHVPTHTHMLTPTPTCSHLQRYWALGSSLPSLKTPHEQLERCQVSSVGPPPASTLERRGDRDDVLVEKHTCTHTHTHRTLVLVLPLPELATWPSFRG